MVSPMSHHLVLPREGFLAIRKITKVPLSVAVDSPRMPQNI